MAKIKLQGNASGTGVLTVTAPNTSTDRTITLPDATGELLNLDGNSNLGVGTTSPTNLGNYKTIATNDSSGGMFEIMVGGTRTANIQSSASQCNIQTRTNIPIAFDINSSEKMRLTSDGLTFNGDTAAANALDDYEEGYWTPTLTCSTSGSYTLDSGANTMAYTKIGRVVHIQGGINITGESSPNGNLKMSLPFTPMTGTDDSDFNEGSASLYNHGGSKPNGIKIFVYGDTHAYFRTIPDNGVGFYLDHGDVDTEFQIRTSFTYIAA